MEYYSIATILIVISAIFGYINVRFIKLPITIGLMLITIVFTIGLVIIGQFDDSLLLRERDFINSIDFETVLLDIMLSFLLFAGALHTNFDQLKVQRGPILAFATLGVMVSTFLVGTIMYYVLGWIGIEVSFIYCLFGIRLLGHPGVNHFVIPPWFRFKYDSMIALHQKYRIYRI